MWDPMIMEGRRKRRPSVISGASFLRKRGRRDLRAQPIQFGVAFREQAFEPGDVLEQAGRGEAQEIESERRVLVVELLDLVVADRQHRPALLALQSLRTLARRREHAE